MGDLPNAVVEIGIEPASGCEPANPPYRADHNGGLQVTATVHGT